MKNAGLVISFFCWFAASAQDKIYLIDGVCLTGKVLEITSDQVIFSKNDSRDEVGKVSVLLIEFENGRVEQFTVPAKDAVYKSGGFSSAHKPQQTQELPRLNHFSVNNLALVNADLALFYERQFADRMLGAGLMAAYNFNKTALIYNANIFVLNNAKKDYDIGAFLHFYPTQLERKKNLYFGIMVKYTHLTFTSLTEDTVWVGSQPSVNLNYKPATGAQLATIFTMGRHINITDNFFIKTLYGIGGFNLKGEYRQQYNYMTNRFNTGAQINARFLLKMYLGLHAGFIF